MNINMYMASLPLPANAVKVNGKYPEQEVVGFRTVMVEGRENFESEIETLEFGDTGPSSFVSKKEEAKELTISYNLVASTKKALQIQHAKLRAMFSVPESRFVFDDDSGYYYIGTASSSEAENINTGGMNESSVSGTITITCTDAYKYATTLKSFVATLDDDGVLKATIVNNGSKAVPINYEIDHNHENGYVGIASKWGAIEIGRIEEVDGYDYKASEALASLSSFATLPDDTGTHYAHPDQKIRGSLGYGTKEGETVLYLQSLGVQEPNSWGGGMRTLTLPADSNGEYGSKNFYVYTNHWFETVDIAQQTGLQSISFLTATNEVICGIMLAKTDINNNSAWVEFRVGDRVVHTVTFEPSMWNDKNPYNTGRGHNDITKEGNKVTFYWWGHKPSFLDDSITNMKCTKIQVSLNNYAGRDLSKPLYLGRNWIKSISFNKFDIDKWKDIPNRYQPTDVLLIDGKAGKVYVNGMFQPNEEIKGSTYFLAPPGETEVEFHYSTFCTTPPTITASIREAYQ